MQILIVGGGGLVGNGVAELLAKEGRLAGTLVTELVLADRSPPKRAVAGTFPIRFAECDVRDSAQVAAAFSNSPDLVFHLAAVMSGPAERDYALGWQINVDGTRNVLEACRSLKRPPRLVFTSSSAVYGEGLPDPVPDDYPPRPRNAYGTQKAVCELMVVEYSRRGFIDGRVGRLAGVAIRPDDTHQGAAAFVTSIVREPLSGRDVVCPVPHTTRMGIITPRTAFASLLHLAALPEDAIREHRITQIPALAVTVGEIIEGVRRVGGAEAVAHIRLDIDPELVTIRKGIASAFSADRARALGFPVVTNIDAVIAEFLLDSGMRLPAAPR